MRNVKILGRETDSEIQDLDVFEFIQQLSSFMLLVITSKHFPPLEALNDLFLKRELDEGMSGAIEWEAFKLDESEREELKERIANAYSIDFEGIEKLDNAANYSEWYRGALKVSAANR
jgi:hypothetical protein